jgi:hypothetical protein
MLIYQLFRPVTGYLSIQHPTKPIVDWVVPGVLSLVATVVVVLVRGKINFYGAGGVVSLLLGYIQNLPGFYIAALAAIATFPRVEIDQILAGNPAPKIVNVDSQGNEAVIELTRRRFLCLMFAFLTAECIILTVLSALGLSVAAPIRGAVPDFAYITLYTVATFSYFMLFFQLIVATFWGIFYLGEKIHQSG